MVNPSPFTPQTMVAAATGAPRAAPHAGKSGAKPPYMYIYIDLYREREG